MKIPNGLKTYLTQLDHNIAMDIWRYLDANEYCLDEMIDIIADSHGMKNQCSPDDSRLVDECLGEWDNAKTSP